MLVCLHFSVSPCLRGARMGAFRMNLEQLTRELEEFLAGSTDAVVLEDGAVMFDLREARYSLSEQHGKCLLHLW